MQDKRFALLIDSDNVSAKYLRGILDELAKHGTITYKRIYGDWTNTQNAKWKQELLENSIIPIQQYQYTIGKNATDSSLIIDAMDILYTGQVDGFCIVSSDSDFTRLASRLRESGMEVIGMGETKTPRAFRAACSIFTLLENLVDHDEQEKITEKQVSADKPVPQKQVKNDEDANDLSPDKSGIVEKSIIEKDIANILIENINQNKKTDLGEVGNRLVNKHPDFDVRNYGYSLLSKFIEDMKSFEIIKTPKTCIIQPINKSNLMIIEFITDLIKQKKHMPLGDLANAVYDKYSNFNVKDYGYSKFSKFIENIPDLQIIDNKNKIKIVHWKN